MFYLRLYLYLLLKYITFRSGLKNKAQHKCLEKNQQVNTTKTKYELVLLILQAIFGSFILLKRGWA